MFNVTAKELVSQAKGGRIHTRRGGFAALFTRTALVYLLYQASLALEIE